MQDHFDVVVVGAGAAGIAALRRLLAAGVSAVALEARERIGGRAQTVMAAGLPLDLGCGWLHSADVNPLAAPIEQAGFTIDRSPPHWTRQSGNQDFPPDEQRAFGDAYGAFEERVEGSARTGVDAPASSLFEPGGRWNHLLDAVSSYYNGAEYDQVSILDYDAYEDTEVNWRVAQGYGAAIAHFAPLEHIVTDRAVTAIDHSGRQIRLTTARGAVSAKAVIVTAPTPILSEGRIAFTPALPEKQAAAAGLPLGLADKAVLLLDEPEAFEKEGHLFGRTDRTETGSYHLRPFGRPYIEVFLGGRLARTLEGEGEGAMSAFAMEELVGLLGSDFRRKARPVSETRWANDPWALGSYSHALPRFAGARAELGRPVGRLFFAGEAVSAHAYSTAHGAWETGVRAAEEALGVLV